MNVFARIETRLPGLVRGVVMVWVVVLILGLYPYTYNPATPIKHLVSACAFGLLAVLVGGFANRSTLVRLAGYRGLWPGALFLLWNLVAALRSDYPAASLNALHIWVVFWGIGALAAPFCQRPEDFWRIAATVGGAAVVSSGYALVQRMGWDPFPWALTNINEYRYGPSTYANPNLAAHALLLAMVLVAGFVFAQHPWSAAGEGRAPARPQGGLRTQDAQEHVPPGCRSFPSAGISRLLPALVALLALPALFVHFYCTHTRGALLGLLCSCVFASICIFLNRFYVISERGIRRLLTATVIAGTLAGAGLWAYSAHRPVAAAAPFDSSIALRVNGYQGAAEMALDRPLSGFGPGVYGMANVPYWTPFEMRWFSLESKKNAHVHCEMLEAAADSGVPGVFLYLFLILSALYGGLLLARRGGTFRVPGLTLAAVFLAFFVDGLFGFNLHVPVSGGLFFLLAGMLAGLEAGSQTGDGEISPSPTANASPFYSPISVLIYRFMFIVCSLLLVLIETGLFRAECRYQRARGALEWAQGHRLSDPKRAQDALSEALRLLDAGKKALWWDGRFPGQEAQTREALGDVNGQRLALEEALALGPNSPNILADLARVHINLAMQSQRSGEGDYLAQAESYARRAQSLAPVWALPEEALGRVALLRPPDSGDAQAKWETVAAHFETAARLGSDNRAELLKLSAQARLRLGQPDLAEQNFEASARLRPQDEQMWRAFRVFAEAESRMPVYIRALEDRLAERASPKVRAALLRHLAVSYGEDSLEREAMRGRIEAALAATPGDLKLWGAYAGCFALEARRTALAQRCAVLPEKGVPPLLRELVQGKDLAAELNAAAMKQFAESDAVETLEAWVWMADVLAQSGVPGGPQSGKTCLDLGQVFCYGGQWAKAEPWLARAVREVPTDTQAAAAMAHSVVLAKLGRVGEALEAAQAAEAAAPGDLSVRWNLAKRLADAGQLEEAKALYADLARLTQNTPEHGQLLREQAAVEAAGKGAVSP